MASDLIRLPEDVRKLMSDFDATFRGTYSRLEEATGEKLSIPELPSDGIDFELRPPEPSLPQMPKLPVLQRVWEWLFGADLNDFKNRAWSAWEPHLSSYFNTVESGARSACRDYLSKANRYLDDRITHYMTCYGQLVNEITEREENEMLRMQMLSTLSHLYAFEAERQAGALRKSSEELASFVWDSGTQSC